MVLNSSILKTNDLKSILFISSHERYCLIILTTAKHVLDVHATCADTQRHDGMRDNYMTHSSRHYSVTTWIHVVVLVLFLIFMILMILYNYVHFTKKSIHKVTASIYHENLVTVSQTIYLDSECKTFYYINLLLTYYSTRGWGIKPPPDYWQVNFFSVFKSRTTKEQS